MSIDKEGLRRAVAELVQALGPDSMTGQNGCTPDRVAEMYLEVLGGLDEDPGVYLDTTFEADHHEMVVLRDIPFFSVCEHDLLPFHGVAHVGYIPRGRVVGIGEIARVVDCLARRPQLQERLTSQIADLIDQKLGPLGVAVVVRAEHLCMTMRGIKKPGTKVVTSANRGWFRKNEATRLEFMSLLDGSSSTS